MKYVFLLATVAAVYFFLSHKAPVAPVVAEVTQKEAAPLTTGPRDPSAALAATPGEHTNALKRPIERTRAVRFKKRNEPVAHRSLAFVERAISTHVVQEFARGVKH